MSRRNRMGAPAADQSSPGQAEAGEGILHSVLAIIVLSLAAAVGLGLARFAYALLLPDMRVSLHWSYAEAGFMNTANAAGYLVGALLGVAAVTRLGAFRAVLLGASGCVVALATLAMTDNFILLSASRTLSGIAAALAFVGGGVLATTIAQSHEARQAFLLSLFYVGPGIGFVLAGVIVPPILEFSGPGSWQTGWMALAAISAVLTLILPLAGRLKVQDRGDSGTGSLRLSDKVLFLAGYFLFGAGISAYLTFVIAWLAETGQSTLIQSATWTCVGLGAVPGPWLWRRAVMHARGGRGTAIVTAATAVGAAVPLALATTATLLLSALLVGSACFCVVAATTVYVRNNFPRGLWPAGIAVMTCMFGAGQIIGPVATGAVTDVFGRLGPALVASVIMLALGSLAAALQPDLAASGNHQESERRQ